MPRAANVCAESLIAKACEEACTLGHSNSCYRFGLTVAKTDKPAARSFFALACKGGSGLGCHQLAEKQTGEHPDSLPFSRIHCEQGDKESCALLGDLYSRSGDTGASAVAYRRACVLGLKTACSEVGD